MCRSPVPVLALALCLAPCAVEGDRDVLGLAREVSVAEHTLGRSGWLGQATSEGATVCCLLSLEPNFKVEIYNASRAQSDLKKCLLIGLADACSDPAACSSSCAEYMKGARRYQDLLADEAKKEAEDAVQEQKKLLVLIDKKIKSASSSAEQEFERAVAFPRAEANKTAKALELAKKDHEVKQKAFEAAKKVLEAAQTAFDAKLSEKKSLEEKAATNKEQAKASAQKEADTQKEQMETRVAEKAKRRDEKAQEAARSTAKPVPEECADPSSNSRAKDCCCSIGGTVMRVSGETFLDWDKCKGAKAYSKTSSLSLPCDYLTKCNKCTDLVCGKTMCP